MKIFTLTANQGEQFANILNLLGSVFFLIAAIIPFLLKPGKTPPNHAIDTARAIE